MRKGSWKVVFVEDYFGWKKFKTILKEETVSFPSDATMADLRKRAIKETGFKKEGKWIATDIGSSIAFDAEADDQSTLCHCYISVEWLYDS